jgi:plastocyanin
MTMSRLLIATLAAASIVGLSCGGDDDGATSTAAEDVTSGEEATTQTTTTSVPGRVDLVTPPGDALVFKPDTATAAAGLVTIVWHNQSKLLHSICLEDPQGKGIKSIGKTVCSTEVKGPSEITGALTETYTDLKPGDYTFYCGVDAHRAQGMEGTLTVE